MILVLLLKSFSSIFKHFIASDTWYQVLLQNYSQISSFKRGHLPKFHQVKIITYSHSKRENQKRSTLLLLLLLLPLFCMLLSILTIFKFLVEGAIPYIEWSCYIHFLKNSKKSLPSSSISNTLNLFLASRPKNYTKKEATKASSIHQNVHLMKKKEALDKNKFPWKNRIFMNQIRRVKYQTLRKKKWWIVKVK